MQVLLGAATLFFCCYIWFSVPVTIGYNPHVPAFFFPSLGWSNTLFFFFSTNSGINPGQPAGKGREKKTLVLTLGSPPEKGGKKNPGINPRQPTGKGRGKKTLGRPPDFDFKT